MFVATQNSHGASVKKILQPMVQLVAEYKVKHRNITGDEMPIAHLSLKTRHEVNALAHNESPLQGKIPAIGGRLL